MRIENEGEMKKSYTKTPSGFFTPIVKADDVKSTQSIHFDAIKSKAASDDVTKTPANSPVRK